MTIPAEAIYSLIEKRISQINTLDFGVILKVDLPHMRADVVLKHKVNDQETTIKNVPVLYPRYGGAALIIAPGPGDVVLVGYTKYERERQLRSKKTETVSATGPYAINNAVILSGTFTAADTVPTLKSGEAILLHKTGAYLKFTDEGGIVMGVKTDVNMVRVP